MEILDKVVFTWFVILVSLIVLSPYLLMVGVPTGCVLSTIFVGFIGFITVVICGAWFA